MVIATDDVNLSAIKTSVQLIDNAMHTGVIPSSALNVSVASSVLPAGASTDNAILSMRVREDDANTAGQYLMGVSAVVRQDTLASLVGTSGDNTQMSVNATGALYCINSATDALLTTIDSDTGDIKTAIQSLDNAVDGNYLNVNQNIAGTDVDSNSGNKSAASQRVVIATDDIPIALVNTKLDHLSDNLDTLETTANNMETLLGSIDEDTNAIKISAQLLDNAVDGNYLNINANIAGTDVDSNSGTKSAATQRVCIATDDIPIALVNTKLDTLETTLELILTKATNIETLNTQLDVVLDNSLVKHTLSTSSELKELLSNVTIIAGALSSQFDTENYEKIRFFGETTALLGLSNIIVMGSNSDGGTFYNLGEFLVGGTTASTHYVFGKFENLPRYIKLLNNHGSTNFTFTKLYLQGSGGRLAV